MEDFFLQTNQLLNFINYVTHPSATHTHILFFFNFFQSCLSVHTSLLFYILLSLAFLYINNICNLQKNLSATSIAIFHYLEPCSFCSIPQSSPFSVFTFFFTFTPCKSLCSSGIINLPEVKRLKNNIYIYYKMGY